MVMKSYFKSGYVFLLLSVFIFSSFSSPVTVTRPAETRKAIVDTALMYMGSPYMYGGSEASGFDCSGLVYRVFLQTTGQMVPRTTRALYAWAEPIGFLELQKGDLVFFNTTGTISHVGIYMGNGRFIHSASAGPKTGVIVSSLDEPYWKACFIGAGRVLPYEASKAFYISMASFGLFGPTTNPTFVYGFGERLILYIDIPLGTMTLQPGVGLLGMWNYYSDSIYCPLIVSLGLFPQFTVFAGWPLTAGFTWEPIGITIKNGPLRGGTLSVIGMAALHQAVDNQSYGSIQGTLSAGLQYRFPIKF